jgi:hypothetical protein
MIFWPSPNFTDRMDSSGNANGPLANYLLVEENQRDLISHATHLQSPSSRSPASRRPPPSPHLSGSRHHRPSAPLRCPLPTRFPCRCCHPAPMLAPSRNPSGSPASPPVKDEPARPKAGYCGPPGPLYAARMSLNIGPPVWPPRSPGRRIPRC